MEVVAPLKVQLGALDAAAAALPDPAAPVATAATAVDPVNATIARQSLLKREICIVLLFGIPLISVHGHQTVFLDRAERTSSGGPGVRIPKT
jgi:hypothetical protein